MKSTVSRRNVLGMGATMAMGLSLPPARVFAQAFGPGPEIITLSAYMSAAGTRALPTEATEQAKHHLLDTLTSMVSGSELPPGEAAKRYISTRAGKGTATIAGSVLTAAPIEAALANGVMAHADETDDSHNASRSHPGCAVVPAALATGEEFGIDGARFLRAVTLGYDIGTRVVLAMGGTEFSYGSSLATHSIAGTFCAAAAAACAAGLDQRQMRWVLDYSAQQSSGILAWRPAPLQVNYVGFASANLLEQSRAYGRGCEIKQRPDARYVHPINYLAQALPAVVGDNHPADHEQDEREDRHHRRSDFVGLGNGILVDREDSSRSCRPRDDGRCYQRHHDTCRNGMGEAEDRREGKETRRQAENYRGASMNHG